MKKRKVALISGIAALAISLTAMYFLDNWRYWPLLMFAGILLMIGTTLHKYLDKFGHGAKFFKFSILSGLLLGLSFPPLFTTFFAFVGFIPLLFLVKLAKEHYPDQSRKIVFRSAYFSFLIWNSLSTFWVTNTAFFAGIFAVFANSFLMTLPIVLYLWICKRLEPKWHSVAFVVSWITFEFLHFRWEITWPWLTLGNSLASWPIAMQWYEFTGVFGGSLWILVVNVLIFNTIQMSKDFKDLPKARIIQLSSVVLMPLIASVFLFFNRNETNNDSIKTLIVQTNYDPHYGRIDISKQEAIDQVIELIRPKINEEIELVVFPETLIEQVNIGEISDELFVKRIREEFEAFPEIQFVVGISGYQFYQIDNIDGLPRSYRALKNRSRGNYNYYEIFNAVLSFGVTRGEEQVYKKSIFVPGAEIFPYPGILFFVSPLVDKLGGSIHGYGKQEKATTLKTDKGNIGSIICYESVFGEYVGGFVKDRAEAFVIVTEDGWWGNTAGHKQHLAYASIRAIEQRKEIARAANTGKSAYINSRGEIEKLLPYQTAGVIEADLQKNKKVTFYAIWGDMIGRISLYTLLLLVSYSVLFFWKKKNEVLKAETEE